MKVNGILTSNKLNTQARWRLNKILLLILSMCWCGISTAGAATYYVGSGEKYTTIQAGISAMSGGDTLIVHDGTYNESISSVPRGSSSAYTTIKAEHDGKVVISGLSLGSSNSYVQIEGLKIKGSSEKGLYGASYIKIMRTAFEGGPSSGNIKNTMIEDSHHILIEDCWFYGKGGRYNLLMYHSDNVVVRRAVIRHDGGWTDSKGDPEAGTNAYSSSHIHYQNCIVIDSDQNYHTWESPFYSTADGSESDISWRGSIALNNKGTGFYLDPKSGSSLSNILIEDCVSYGHYRGMAFGSQGSASGTVNRVTVGNSDEDGLAKWGGGGSISVKNAIVWDVAGEAFRGVSNSNSYTQNPTSQGLLYLPRIESGSYLSKAGQSGGQIGAQIVKRIGVSGTLIGEPGWDTVTAENLWPFPNEERIKADMATVSTRGFCTSGNTLTTYIWEYLGKNMPSDIGLSRLPNPDITNISIQ